MTRSEQLARTITLFQTELDIADAKLVEHQLTKLKVALVAARAPSGVTPLSETVPRWVPPWNQIPSRLPATGRQAMPRP